ncbi:rhodanese-related sulfurtransferase [Thermocatellispora tengchongensis]|uniref:Rhodanese-related sulfurtransferase n=1 Tax=Thermocatellispora tengchongensis TaxID=1073253 RepID=A0A840P6R6_9ACTN|nr:rhodanese-like domain-containing protein [Thermocatellispora tengchongensis]MBB5133603.1 rhodanese-related sulfurtransferase [Thermocatellispora tengchongensis]
MTDIERMLARARAGPARLRPAEAWAAAGRGALIVDIRPEAQRRAAGEVPGAVVVERNHLEWRLDPASSARIPEAASHRVRWIVICAEGYSSSLAAASLRRLGLYEATDVIGGFEGGPATACPRSARPAPPRPAAREPPRRPEDTTRAGGDGAWWRCGAVCHGLCT